MSKIPKIAISIGDPAGVGAEIALKAMSDPAVAPLAQWMLMADSAAIDAAARITGIDPGALPCSIVEPGSLAAHHQLVFGQASRRGYGLAAVEYVRRAVTQCLSGEADAMVTAPLNKEAVTLLGHAFSGHTEYIAELTGSTESRMLWFRPAGHGTREHPHSPLTGVPARPPAHPAHHSTGQ